MPAELTAAQRGTIVRQYDQKGGIGKMPLKASELITKLQAMVDEHGDLDVHSCGDDVQVVEFRNDPDAGPIIAIE